MNFKNIPEELRVLPNWACYKSYQAKDGKHKKSSSARRTANSQNPTNRILGRTLKRQSATACAIAMPGLLLRSRKALPLSTSTTPSTKLQAKSYPPKGGSFYLFCPTPLPSVRSAVRESISLSKAVCPKTP